MLDRQTERYYVNCPEGLDYDVSAFEAAIKRASTSSGEAVREHLEEAAALYGGDYLTGVDMDWARERAEILRVAATFAFMEVMGFTINNITILGLILAVGIVIDDAVVVHENIFRYMEENGTPAREAASLATREIALAVVATTLSLLVIFIPIAFMAGRVGAVVRHQDVLDGTHLQGLEDRAGELHRQRLQLRHRLEGGADLLGVGLSQCGGHGSSLCSSIATKAPSSTGIGSPKGR